MAFLKAIIPGGLLTFVIAMIIGGQGSDGGLLAIYHAHPPFGEAVYWSWPLFLCGTLLSWALITITPR